MLEGQENPDMISTVYPYTTPIIERLRADGSLEDFEPSHLFGIVTQADIRAREQLKGTNGFVNQDGSWKSQMTEANVTQREVLVENFITREILSLMTSRATSRRPNQPPASPRDKKLVHLPKSVPKVTIDTLMPEYIQTATKHCVMQKIKEPAQRFYVRYERLDKAVKAVADSWITSNIPDFWKESIMTQEQLDAFDAHLIQHFRKPIDFVDIFHATVNVQWNPDGNPNAKGKDSNFGEQFDKAYRRFREHAHEVLANGDRNAAIETFITQYATFVYLNALPNQYRAKIKASLASQKDLTWENWSKIQGQLDQLTAALKIETKETSNRPAQAANVETQQSSQFSPSNQPQAFFPPQVGQQPFFMYPTMYPQPVPTVPEQKTNNNAGRGGNSHKNTKGGRGRGAKSRGGRGKGQSH